MGCPRIHSSSQELRSEGGRGLGTSAAGKPYSLTHLLADLSGVCRPHSFLPDDRYSGRRSRLGPCHSCCLLNAPYTPGVRCILYILCVILMWVLHCSQGQGWLDGPLHRGRKRVEETVSGIQPWRCMADAELKSMFAQAKAQPLSHCAMLLSYRSTDLSSNLPSLNGRPSTSGFS